MSEIVIFEDNTKLEMFNQRFPNEVKHQMSMMFNFILLLAAGFLTLLCVIIKISLSKKDTNLKKNIEETKQRATDLQNKLNLLNRETKSLYDKHQKNLNLEKQMQSKLKAMNKCISDVPKREELKTLEKHHNDIKERYDHLSNWAKEKDKESEIQKKILESDFQTLKKKMSSQEETVKESFQRIKRKLGDIDEIVDFKDQLKKKMRDDKNLITVHFRPAENKRYFSSVRAFNNCFRKMSKYTTHAELYAYVYKCWIIDNIEVPEVEGCNIFSIKNKQQPIKMLPDNTRITDPENPFDITVEIDAYINENNENKKKKIMEYYDSWKKKNS